MLTIWIFYSKKKFDKKLKIIYKQYNANNYNSSYNLNDYDISVNRKSTIEFISMPPSDIQSDISSNRKRTISKTGQNIVLKHISFKMLISSEIGFKLFADHLVREMAVEGLLFLYHFMEIKNKLLKNKIIKKELIGLIIPISHDILSSNGTSYLHTTNNNIKKSNNNNNEFSLSFGAGNNTPQAEGSNNDPYALFRFANLAPHHYNNNNKHLSPVREEFKENKSKSDVNVVNIKTDVNIIAIEKQDIDFDKLAIVITPVSDHEDNDCGFKTTDLNCTSDDEDLEEEEEKYSPFGVAVCDIEEKTGSKLTVPDIDSPVAQTFDAINSKSFTDNTTNSSYNDMSQSTRSQSTSEPLKPPTPTDFPQTDINNNNQTSTIDNTYTSNVTEKTPDIIELTDDEDQICELNMDPDDIRARDADDDDDDDDGVDLIVTNNKPASHTSDLNANHADGCPTDNTNPAIPSNQSVETVIVCTRKDTFSNSSDGNGTGGISIPSLKIKLPNISVLPSKSPIPSQSQSNNNNNINNNNNNYKQHHSLHTRIPIFDTYSCFRMLFDRYILSDAVMSINIDSESRTLLIEVFTALEIYYNQINEPKQLIKFKSITITNGWNINKYIKIFDHAASQVYRLLSSDPFIRFTATEEYVEFHSLVYRDKK